MKKILAIFILLLISLSSAAAFGDEQPQASMYLWRLINEARVYPLRTIGSLGIDEETARLALGDDAWMFDQGLPPLAWNDALFQAATGHNQDMVAQLHYSSTGLDGSSVANRIAVEGYDAVAAGELLGLMAFPNYMEPLETAEMVFQCWLMDELSIGYQGDRRIFSRDFTELGCSFNAAVLELGEAIPHNVYVAVIDFACPQEPRVFLLGNVFQDVNGDGRWNYGEGRPGVGMSFQGVGGGEAGIMDSGVFGAYQVEISGFYCTVSVLDDQGQPVLKRMINGMALGRENNEFFDFSLQ